MKVFNHPNIMKHLGHFEYSDGSNGKHLCVLMKSMDMNGSQFKDSLRVCRKMTSGEKTMEVLFLLLQTARGLKYLHRMKILHLDMKLDNVLINSEKGSDKLLIEDLRIIDFGGSKENDLRVSTVLQATEDYASPEVQSFKTFTRLRKRISILRKMMSSSLGHVFGLGLGGNDSDSRKNIQLTLNRIIELIRRLDENSFDLVCENASEELEFVIKTVNENSDLVRLDGIMEARLQIFELKKICGTKSSMKRPFLDQRADIFSFGKMVESFSNLYLKNYHELISIMRRCLNHDRRERPSLNEIISVLKTHLKFFDLN